MISLEEQLKQQVCLFYKSMSRLRLDVSLAKAPVSVVSSSFITSPQPLCLWNVT